MKTAELIRQLQDADPTGELEVTVGKNDIWFLQTLPCYYDGHTEILVRDPALTEKCYDVIGAEVRSKGRHVMIETHSIRDMLADDPDLPVTFDSENGEHKYGHRIQAMRDETRARKSKAKQTSTQPESN